ncbi:MAG TPA: hypothetical protein DCW72_11045 [Elusimicrobia bacterium]|nr:hypothetical protein [Elusimicrobiota bacterium]
MMMSLRSFTQAFRKSTPVCEMDPFLISSASVNGLAEKRRMVSVGPETASGGMMPLTREPSFRRASTSGTDSSMRRPRGATMRFMTCMICSSLRNLYLVSVSLPDFSM